MAEWSIPMDKLAEKTNQKIEDVVRKSTIEIFSRVIMRTPVDTGRARGNWIASYNRFEQSTSDFRDKSGKGSVAVMKGQVMSFPIGGTVWLTNSLPYAVVLEYGLYPNPPKIGSKKRGETEPRVHTVGGYSMQAPQGMVRKTVLEFEAAVKEALE